MAPHRKARANQPQPPPQPSDYETDAPPAVDVPLPPPRSNEELNFSVLRRQYADLLSIEHVTPYAALYTFNLETQSWEKMGIEGTLFICQLTPSPIGAERYCAIILNRRGLENFYQELTSSEEMEISDPYHPGRAGLRHLDLRRPAACLHRQLPCRDCRKDDGYCRQGKSESRSP